MPSWKTMVHRSSEWITADDLAGRSPITLEVESYEQKGARQDDGSEEMLLAIRFKGAHKPLGCNVTNGTLIESVIGTDEMDAWIGKKITLRRAICKGMECVRVDAPAGTKLPRHCPKFRYVD